MFLLYYQPDSAIHKHHSDWLEFFEQRKAAVIF